MQTKKFKDRGIIINFGHVKFNIKNPDKVRFVKVTSYRAVEEHLPAKYYVDEAAVSSSIDESPWLRLDRNENI